ncbi:MAG: LysE family translocator [Balneolaceae bacterium]|nr:LysE family translocator [Balneolaceae bacterium]MBO6547683.1 LysE family translocator [Balneolaceae bacterium]MBO6648194.1 LysE family translocator [Balneolaceae bacterium]
MTEIHSFLLFLGLSWVLIITPGPDLIYVLTQGVSSGRKAGLISAIGVTLGIFVHTLFAALGLSIILKTSAIAFSVVKIGGALYLIYLGLKTIFSDTGFEISKSDSTSSRKIFLQGLISNTLNPKVALFFMAFLPQFIHIGAAEQTSSIPFILLGTIFAICSLFFLSALGYFSGALGQYLSTRESVAKWIQNVSGSIMILMGIKLAFARQN